MTEATEQPSDQEAPKDLAELLQQQVGAPSSEQIDAWKEEHGEVFCSGFSETEMFIWRPLRRQEFRTLQEQLAAGAVDQFQYEDRIVETCIIWPDLGPHGAVGLGKKAGTITTLADQIMQNSNFLPPQLAATLIRKL